MDEYATWEMCGCRMVRSLLPRTRPKRRGPIWVQPSRGLRQPHRIPQPHPLDVCRRGRTWRSEHGSREAQNGDER